MSFAGETPTASSFGMKGAAIAPSDTTDLATTAKAVVVTDVSAGADLSILPAGNPDGAWIDFVGVPVGFIPPFRVRRVKEASTAVVASVDG